MSAADGVRISPCALSVVEICAARGRTSELTIAMQGHGLEFPDPGHVSIGAERLVLCFRPSRWWIITSPGTSNATMNWNEAAQACGDALGAAVDLSAAHAAFLLQGPSSAEALARGCRLDLDPQVFPPGSAAATIIAQVQVCLAALPIGMLLLAPSSMSRHFNEWLHSAARPFGLMPQSAPSMADLCRSRIT